MSHVVVMKCLMIPFTVLVSLPLWIHIELLWKSQSQRFKNWGVRVGGSVYRLHCRGSAWFLVLSQFHTLFILGGQKTWTRCIFIYSVMYVYIHLCTHTNSVPARLYRICGIQRDTGRGFFTRYLFSPVSVSLPVLCTHSFIYHRQYKILVVDSIIA
jgi:hypothetical protein